MCVWGVGSRGDTWGMGDTDLNHFGAYAAYGLKATRGQLLSIRRR